MTMTTLQAIMRFSVNGSDQGIAFRVPKSVLAGRALFPHVLTKNQDFTVNFGQVIYLLLFSISPFLLFSFSWMPLQMPGPLCPLEPGYTPIGQLDFADGIVRGPEPPNSRGECEAVMMIGQQMGGSMLPCMPCVDV